MYLWPNVHWQSPFFFNFQSDREDDCPDLSIPRVKLRKLACIMNILASLNLLSCSLGEKLSEYFVSYFNTREHKSFIAACKYEGVFIRWISEQRDVECLKNLNEVMKEKRYVGKY